MAVPYILIEKFDETLDRAEEHPYTDNAKHIMVRTHRFQEVTKELFLGLYPKETETDKDVRFIMVWRRDTQVLKNDSQPHPSLVGEPGVPIVCLPFVLNNPTPCETALDYQLHVKADKFLKEFLNLIQLLSSQWFEAKFEDVPAVTKEPFLAATKDFAREYILFTNPGEETKEVIRNSIPNAFFQFLTLDEHAKMRFLHIKAAYWALFGHSLPLTEHSVQGGEPKGST